MADLAIRAQAQDINFVTKFDKDLHNLLEVLGKTEVQIMAPGTALKTYKASGTAGEGTAAENAEIPNAGIKMGDAEITELAYKKYRNLTSIEAIGKQGYEVAVGGTNDKLLRDVQAGIRRSIYTAIEKGTGAAEAADFQKKISKAAAYLSKKCEDEAVTPVFFANPDDVFEYLGAHNITLEQMFGLSYLSNFMGIGNVVVDSNVTAGTVIGTVCENLDVVAADLTSIPEMEMTTDETGLIAVHNGPRYANGAVETVVYSGIAVSPVYADRIVKVTTGA